MAKYAFGFWQRGTGSRRPRLKRRASQNLANMIATTLWRAEVRRFSLPPRPRRTPARKTLCNTAEANRQRPLPEPEVAQAVEDVAQNTIIRGTKEYNKDEYIAGAVAATSTPVFPPWTEGGKVFYKVRKQALDPRNFKQGACRDSRVRYVEQP